MADEIRAFLDANILFSAAYLERSGMKRLWTLEGVQLMSSHYAVEEAALNLTSSRQKAELRGLLDGVEVTCSTELPEETRFREPHGLPEKDQPILWAAVDAKCSYLITGDKRHFGHLMDTEVDGVTVIRAAKFLDLLHHRVKSS